MTVVILLADGVRPDTLATAIDSGKTPALARMREEGAMHRITSCFPSVTGPAYTPFLMGRFPGNLGVPGLRWFDRARSTCSFPDFTRSYVGFQVNRINLDLDAGTPTMFEICQRSLGSMTPVWRGLPVENRLGRLSMRTAWRAARTHFSGAVDEWLGIDRELADVLVDRIREERPEFTFAALMGVDKSSHSTGQPSPMTDEALRIVDATAARIRADAERNGTWQSMHLWVTSDHGHSPVSAHEDLAGLVAGWGYRTVSHPWIYKIRPEVAVMVSGNSMAHVYLDLASREKPRWPKLKPKWRALSDMLLERPSIDLMILPTDDGALIRSARGDAELRIEKRGIRYSRQSGDPLAIGADVENLCDRGAYDATAATDYPDSLTQIARIASCGRSGEIILSGARGWDFRAKYEPIPHVSTHGALHQEHMFVPFLTNRQYSGTPRRTTDVMPSALAALGRTIPHGLDGTSFI